MMGGAFILGRHQLLQQGDNERRFKTFQVVDLRLDKSHGFQAAKCIATRYKQAMDVVILDRLANSNPKVIAAPSVDRQLSHGQPFALAEKSVAMLGLIVVKLVKDQEWRLPQLVFDLN